MTYLNRMLNLTLLDADCDEVQIAIDYARAHFGASDQLSQMLLDDKQNELDAKRELIKTIMSDIAHQN